VGVGTARTNIVLLVVARIAAEVGIRARRGAASEAREALKSVT
jgi:hypothetical protein